MCGGEDQAGSPLSPVPAVGELTRGVSVGELSGSLPLSPHMAPKAGPEKPGNNVSSAASSSPLPTSLFNQPRSSTPLPGIPPPFFDLTPGALWVCPHHSDARLSPSKRLPPWNQELPEKESNPGKLCLMRFSLTHQGPSFPPLPPLPPPSPNIHREFIL